MPDLALETLSKMMTGVDRFQRDILDLPIPDSPQMLSEDRYRFRLAHLHEEIEEIRKAYEDDHNMVETADGLLDLIYVAMGVLIEMGVAPGAAFEEVHRANMEKVRGKTHRRGSGYDAAKPEGWMPPDLTPYLTATRNDLYSLVRGRKRPNIIIVGWARAGKDTVAEMLRDRYGFRFASSSQFLAADVIHPALVNMPQSYATWEECFADRGANRALWYEMIRFYNRHDRTALAKAIFARYNVYCGMRDKEELMACKINGLANLVLWIDAGPRAEKEPESSNNITSDMADVRIHNGQPLDSGSLEEQLDKLFGHFKE